MARPTKQGLDYFPFDVGFFGDNKIRILITRYQSEGLAVYLYILCDIYKEGYYKSVEDMDDYIYIIADAVKTSPDKVQQIIAFLRKRAMVRIFEKDELTVCDLDAVITSHGIQKRYAEAIKSRKKSISDINRGYWLLTEEEEAEINAFYKSTKNEGFSENNPSFSENNPDKSEKNPIKESKVKEKDRSIDLSKKNSETPTDSGNTDQVDETYDHHLSSLLQAYPAIKVDITSTAQLYGKDFARVMRAFENSEYLRTQAKSLSWICKFYSKIVDGGYDGNDYPHIASGGEVGELRPPRVEYKVL